MSTAKSIFKIVDDLQFLSQPAEEINTLQKNSDVVKIIGEIKDTLRANKEVVALVAPQLKYNARIFCIKFEGGDIRAFINPMITKTEGLHLTRERNPSLPGKEYIIPRHNKVLAMYQTPTGRVEQNQFEGVVAEIFEQQVNLLDGILLCDVGLEVIPEFDTASDEEKEAVLKWYLNNLQGKSAALEKEIGENKDLLETKKAIDFMKGVALGEIKIEKVDDLKVDNKNQDKKDA